MSHNCMKVSHILIRCHTILFKWHCHLIILTHFDESNTQFKCVDYYTLFDLRAMLFAKCVVQFN